MPAVGGGSGPLSWPCNLLQLVAPLTWTPAAAYPTHLLRLNLLQRSKGIGGRRVAVGQLVVPGGGAWWLTGLPRLLNWS